MHTKTSGEPTDHGRSRPERPRRGRERGLRGLGQPLKSFRDRKVDFEIYKSREATHYLKTLGPLTKPQRGSTAGLEPGRTAVQESPYQPRIPGAELPAGVSLPFAEPGKPS